MHALQDQQLQVYAKQVHTIDVQEALACALEYESFRMSGNRGVPKSTANCQSQTHIGESVLVIRG